jgi:Flp pilus assembly protein TadD
VAVTAAAAGDPGRALEALLAAHALAPTRAESSSRLALFLASAGRYADAARWFERAYRNAPSAALAEDAARAWTKAGEPERARSWSGRALGAGRVG